MRARLPPLSSCHQQSLLLLSGAEEGGPPAVLTAACISCPPGSRGPPSRPASCLLSATSRLPFPRSSFEVVVHAAGCIRPRSCRRPRASATPPSPHTSKGAYRHLAAVFRGPSAEESALAAAFALAFRSIAFPRASGCTRAAARALLRGRRGGGVPGGRPQPPPSEVCFPPLPGWGKCASGRRVPVALTQRVVPAGPGQVTGGIFNGVLKQPEIQLFVTRGETGGTCPAIWSRLERARERASPC